VSKPAFGVGYPRALALIADILSTREHHWAVKSAGATVADLMTKDVRRAARRMLDRGVMRMPVVADGKVVGIVARRDVLKILIRV